MGSSKEKEAAAGEEKVKLILNVPKSLYNNLFEQACTAGMGVAAYVMWLVDENDDA